MKRAAGTTAQRKLDDDDKNLNKAHKVSTYFIPTFSLFVYLREMSTHYYFHF